MTTLLDAMKERAERMVAYATLRADHPEVPAAKILGYLKGGDGQSFAEFTCTGHKWAYTGTAYGGDDSSYLGEGRCYCVNCGADGDA